LCASFVVLTFVLIQFYDLIWNPSANYGRELTYGSVDFYSPSLTTKNYASFPIVSLRQFYGESLFDKTKDKDVNDAFDIYLALSTVN
jgi:hypothetical protein